MEKYIYFGTFDYNKFTNNILDAKKKEKILVNERTLVKGTSIVIEDSLIDHIDDVEQTSS